MDRIPSAILERASGKFSGFNFLYRPAVVKTIRGAL